MKYAWLILLPALVTIGCRASGPAVDEGPFRTAITAYLKKHSMDMRVNEFKRLTVDGTNATAQVSLKAADPDLAGPAVRWKFSFKQDGGTWAVASHEQ